MRAPGKTGRKLFDTPSGIAHNQSVHEGSNMADAVYRELTDDDLEQAAHLEAVAFYNPPSEERVELLRKFYPANWTVGAFIDGRLIADVRTIPAARRINGGSIGFGMVGPVTCLPEYRRQGHVGRLLRMSLERMRDGGQAISGLHTPHDALYARYGWERAEGKKRYVFSPKDARLRHRGKRGSLQSVSRDDWARLDAIYRRYAEQRNGPIQRPEVWWKEAVMRHYEETGAAADNTCLTWVSQSGEDEGYLVYRSAPHPAAPGQAGHDLWVRDFVALSGNAYLGLWEHLLTHDIANQIVIDVPQHDPFPDLCEDPWKIDIQRTEGAMLRIVDVGEALNRRPHAGDWAANFTMRIIDESAPWNDATWCIDAAEGSMAAERTDDEPDVELTAGALAPIFTGYMRADVAANVGLLSVRRPGVVDELLEAFAVRHPPFSHDYY